MFVALIPELGKSDMVSLVSTYRSRYSEIGFSENTIYPEISTSLESLHEANIRLGLCTSKRVDFAEKILAMFGIDRLFSFIDGGDIGITKRMQLAALIDTGTIDRAAVMVGDRAVDIEAASANGLRSIGVLWGFGSSEELRQASPTHIAESPHELYKLVT